MNREETLKAIDREVRSSKIFMYVKGTKDAPQCGFSAATIALFKKLGRPFETFDVIANPDRRAFVPEYSNWPTFPQIFIDGKFVGGCDVVHEMHDQGELGPLVERAFGGASRLDGTPGTL